MGKCTERCWGAEDRSTVSCKEDSGPTARCVFRLDCFRSVCVVSICLVFRFSFFFVPCCSSFNSFSFLFVYFGFGPVGLVWFGLTWCVFVSVRFDSFGLVLSCLVWFGLVLSSFVWFGLLRFGVDWSALGVMCWF